MLLRERPERIHQDLIYLVKILCDLQGVLSVHLSDIWHQTRLFGTRGGLIVVYSFVGPF